MSDTAKTNLLKYGLSGGTCAAMVVIYAWLRDFGTLPLVEKYLVLCDGFTLPGVLFLALGCMIWISAQGALDGIGYVVSYAVKMLIPGKKEEQERYYDYVERRREKRVKGYGFLFVVGGVCMVFVAVFMILFYSVYQG